MLLKTHFYWQELANKVFRIGNWDVEVDLALFGVDVQCCMPICHKCGCSFSTKRLPYSAMVYVKYESS